MIKNNDKAVVNWLLTCALLVIIMIIIGGYTRLMNAGLSIVEWRPITGILPPLNEIEWLREFAKYQHSPQYQKINYSIALNEFKHIYLIEYIHRLMGRIIGLVFLLPFIYFKLTKRLDRILNNQLILIFILGFSQAIIGWYMVKSGLINNPHVSQYRLTLHLLVAALIISLISYQIFKLTIKPTLNKSLFRTSLLILFFTLIQITFGGLVAGLRAGLVYNSFPLMDKKLIPVGLFITEPWYLNFFENPILVQFIHRVCGILILIMISFLFKNYYFSSRINKLQKLIILILLVLVIIQVTLGIFTLILMVPLSLALLHQLGAIFLLVSALSLAYSAS